MTASLVLTASRFHFFKTILESIHKSWDDRITELVVILDCETKHVTKYTEVLKSFTHMHRVIHTNMGYPPNTGIKVRRKRIAKIHRFIQQQKFYSEHLIFIEDDTIISTDGIKKLFKLHSIYPTAGLVSGIQVGRHGIEYIGAWKVDDVYNPQKIQSIGFKDKQVDATGFYFFMIRTDVYKKTVFDDEFDGLLGPDV